MSTTDPAPTFSNWKDRAAYAIAEYKIVIASVILAASILIGLDRIDLTVPGWVAAALTAYMLLGPPAYVAGRRIVRWVRERMWVEVFHINAVEDVREKYLVPPKVWEEKRVDGPAPWPVNGGSAWEVREYEWMDDIGELRVRGTYFAACKDSELVTARTQLKDVHGYLEESHMAHIQLRSRVSRMALDVQKSTVNSIMEGIERGVSMVKTAVKSAWEDAQDDIDGEIDEELPDIDPSKIQEDDAWMNEYYDDDLQGSEAVEKVSNGQNRGDRP